MLWQIHGETKQAGLRFFLSGNNTIVAAPSGTNLLIHALVLVPSADVTVKVKCGSRTVADLDLLANMTYSCSDNPGQDGSALYECKSGEAFIVNLGAAVQVTGQVIYSYIDTTL